MFSVCKYYAVYILIFVFIDWLPQIWIFTIHARAYANSNKFKAVDFLNICYCVGRLVQTTCVFVFIQNYPESRRRVNDRAYAIIHACYMHNVVYIWDNVWPNGISAHDVCVQDVGLLYGVFV